MSAAAEQAVAAQASAVRPAYWLAVVAKSDCECREVAFGLAADDGNGGELARSHVNQFINNRWLDGERLHLVGVYANPRTPTPARGGVALAGSPTDMAQALIDACVPSGNVCDPQAVADNIRDWFARATIASKVRA